MWLGVWHIKVVMNTTTVLLDQSEMAPTDRPWELMGYAFTLPNGKKARVVWFSQLFESDVVVGEIAGEARVKVTRLPRTPILLQRGKIVGYLVKTENAPDGSAECVYETYNRVFTQASGPLRQGLVGAGVDLPRQRARMQRLFGAKALPAETD